MTSMKAAETSIGCMTAAFLVINLIESFKSKALYGHTEYIKVSRA